MPAPGEGVSAWGVSASGGPAPGRCLLPGEEGVCSGGVCSGGVCSRGCLLPGVVSATGGVGVGVM